MNFETWSAQSLQGMLVTLPMLQIDDSFAMRQQMPRLVLVSGESLSVQVGEYNYCSPRDDRGPWTAVEVGLPSCLPPETWMPYCEDPDSPLNTVYASVPFSLVMMFIGAHGGIDIDATFPPRVVKRLKF